MKQHVNFYESLTEANMRINKTIVLYDGEPYHVMAVTDHKGDGVFRVYLEPLTGTENFRYRERPDISYINPDNPALGGIIDQWMKTYPNSGILRKKMDSSYFNKFRPFPLGMCNVSDKVSGSAYYLERQPLRPRTEQGLTTGMVQETRLTLGQSKTTPRGMGRVDLFTPAFRSCVLGQHPSAKECLENLKDPTITNESVAFHRHFAFVRGPFGMLFLAYKNDVVGFLPRGDFSEVKLGKDFSHTREVIQDLNLFGSVSVQ